MTAPRPLIDAHAHMGYSPRFHVPGGDAADLQRLLQELGVQHAICMHQAELEGHHDEAHREIMEAFEASGGALLAYVLFNPHQPDAARRVAQRLAQGPPYIGIKLHPPFHLVSADDEVYHPAWEIAAERGACMLSHTWDRVLDNPAQGLSYPELFSGWLERYPQVRLIMGHAGGRTGGHLAAVRMARRFANVYVDLAGDSYTWGLIEWLVAEIGAERVLYGSDLTWMDPRTHLGRVLAADLTEEARALILGGNARRLFGLTARGCAEEV